MKKYRILLFRAAISDQDRFMNPMFIENEQVILKKWDNKWGDRMNEIVIIGQDLNIENIKTELQHCLINEIEEMSMDSEYYFEDNWPI